MKRLLFIIYFLSIFLLADHANCQFPRVDYIGIEKGLSNNAVRCIYQDHKGFMWFGTYDGLNRYDGYEFKVFRNNINDSASLIDNWITSISEDRNSNIWIGTRQGICLYNHLTSKIVPAYYIPSGEIERKKITGEINIIDRDAKGNILVGTASAGLLYCAAGTTGAIQVPLTIKGKVTTQYNVRAMEAGENEAWLIINGIGLCVFDYGSKSIRLINSSVYSSACIVKDNRGNIWIGSDQGVYQYQIASNSYIEHFDERSGKLKSDKIAGLCIDRNDQLWIATDGGGINILNTRTGEFTYLLPDQNQVSLTSEAVYAIYEDKESRKWIGTLRGGINIIDPWKTRFQTVAHNPLNANSLINNFVLSFYEEKDNLWIGTDGAGLSIWNRTLNTFTNFRHTSDGSSLSSNFVTGITKDFKNNIWVATFGGGINLFNKNDNTFKIFRCINSSGHEERKIWSLYEDVQKDLWAGLVDGRLYRFNHQLNKFQEFDRRLMNVLSMYQDRENTFWAGNFRQLIKVDKEKKEHEYINIGRAVRAIHEDRLGNFWIGTEGGGLLQFDRKNRTFTRYTTSNGLSNDAVLNILEDKKGNLWLSTFNGISKFNIGTKSFTNFYLGDGLQSNQFNYNAAIALKSGEFAFGGIKGFNLFHPDKINPVTNTPPLLLTEFNIDNKPVYADPTYVTKKDIDKVLSIKLPYNEAIISFEFAALEYSAPDKISYAYFLEGWDKDWNYIGNSRTANYSHLTEGNYTLRVKCTNADGLWNPKETTLMITVLPPWYRTWWAYLLYAAIATGLIYYYILYKARQTKLEYEVKIAHLNIEKEREINERKLSFFTDVSHEFRTPLTLIINPIKDLLNKNDEGQVNNELNIVYRNARRLLSLVDQLLLFRKADIAADNLKISKINFSSLCKDVYLSFIQQARIKKITYLFETTSEETGIYADKEKIEIALFNLVSNALKYTPEDGTVIFRVSEHEHEVEVAVIDNGPGIPEDVGNKLFEKFYRVQSKSSYAKVGFGIGLYLVDHFVKKHKGEIEYQSAPGKGTTFSMKLKKGRSHFANELIHEEEVEKSVMLQELVEDPVEKDEKSRLDALISDRKSLLIVEDDQQLCKYISEIFKDKFVIYTAETGEEGLKLAHQNTPDIIISDITMQGMSGIDLCRTIKETSALSHIPVILLTGTSSDEIRLKGAELGAHDFITKPFEKTLLLARVESILKNRTVLQNYFYNEITMQKNTLKVSAEYKEFLDTCIRIVERHLDNDQFSIQTLASEIGMSHSALYKKVKSISGQSVNSFIRFIRLRKAAELLITTDCNVNEAAFKVGFNDIKYFRSQFNKLFGMNPSDYLKKFKKPFNRSFTLSDDAVRVKGG